MNSKHHIFALMLIFGLFCSFDVYAQDVLELEDDELTSKVPPPPEVDSFRSLTNLDKAIELKLEESFIVKITDSMKKNPF